MGNRPSFSSSSSTRYASYSSESEFKEGDTACPGAVRTPPGELADRLCDRNPASRTVTRAAGDQHATIKKPTWVHRRADTVAVLNATSKSAPYISTKHVDQLASLNAKAKIGDEPIVCRHLAAQFILTGRADMSRKIAPHELFGSVEQISETVSADIEKKYEDLVRSACGRHIVACDNFGGFLAGQAKRMRAGDKRLFLLESGNHTMAFELRCKPGQLSGGRGKDRFVVRFFDPNRTNVVARCQVEHADAFKPGRYAFKPDRYALRRFMTDGSYRAYFLGDGRYPAEKECLILNCSDPQHPDPRFATLETASEKGVSATLMYHLLREGNDPDAIRDIERSSVFQSGSAALRREVLEAKNAEGLPGLQVALQRGHAAAIAAYGELLARLPPAERSAFLKDLLTAKRADGAPGLLMALQNGHAGAIAAYGTLLDLLPAAERHAFLKELLTAKAANGVPGLYLALQNGHAGAIAAYGKLLDLLPAAERHAFLKELLTAKAANGVPGLYMALQNGHAGAIAAYGKLLDLLPAAERHAFLTELLAAKDADGVPGLFMALRNGHASAIVAYGKLLDLLPPAERQAFFKELLAAKNADGVPGLYMALYRDNADAIKAYGTVLEEVEMTDTECQALLNEIRRIGLLQVDDTDKASVAYNQVMSWLEKRAHADAVGGYDVSGA